MGLYLNGKHALPVRNKRRLYPLDVSLILAMAQVSKMKQRKIREAVGVFDDPKELDEAVAELEVTAFPRHDISILGSDGESFSQKEHEDNPNASRGISIRPEEKSIGAGVLIGCCAYIAGCAVAIAAKATSGFAMLAAITGGSIAGAAVGAVIVLAIGRKIKARIEKKIRNGGLVLWVRIAEPENGKLALDIMRRHGGKHVHINRIA